MAECSSIEKLGLDLVRASFLENVISPIAEKGHSVWSNACTWHGIIMRNDQYYSENQRTASGEKLTIQEAVEKFVFDNEKIVEIDEYTWPFNTGCAF